MRLRLTPEPDAHRSVLLMVDMGDVVLFRGNAADAPSMHCGSCYKTLVSGVFLRQFADGRRTLKPTGLSPVSIPAGRFGFRTTIEIPDRRLVTVGEQGH